MITVAILRAAGCTAEQIERAVELAGKATRRDRNRRYYVAHRLKASESERLKPSETTESVLKRKPGADTKFEQFWVEKPSREGSNPRHVALKRWRALVKSGVDADTIIAGAIRWRFEEQRLKHIGTPYVAQAATWLNQRRWADDGPANVTPIESPAERSRREAHEIRKRRAGETIATTAGTARNRCADQPQELLEAGAPLRPDRAQPADGRVADHRPENGRMAGVDDLFREPRMDANQHGHGGDRPRAGH